MQRAGYLLMNFPSLCRQVENQRENILEGYRQGAFVGGSRGSGYSDPTAKRGIKLIELSALDDLLYLVAAWLDNELKPEDRPLLLAVWRYRKYGLFNWHWVAKELNQGVWVCRERLKELVEQLEDYLSKKVSAGTVSGPDGIVCVGGRKKEPPE